MLKYLHLKNFDLKDKTIGVRIDINSPIINGKIVLNERLIKHSKTLNYLSKKGAKVVVLAHQGRKGKDDCISLKSHSKILSDLIKKDIKFIPEVYSKKVENEITKLNSGDILLLENLRFYDDELDPNLKNNKIKKLENLFDFYVLDAFSIAHRNQTSIVGFQNIPNLAGLIMEEELRGLNKILDTEPPHIFVFGGAKPDDLVELLEADLKKEKVDLILLSGVIGEIALHLKGYNIGKKLEFLKDHQFLNSKDKIKKLLDKYPEKFIIPKDVAYLDKNEKRIEISIDKLNSNKDIDKYLIEDIGKKTIQYFSIYLKSAKSIYFKGPPGNFEKKGLEFGTKELIKAIVNSKNAFTFMGGGHSVTAAKEYGHLNKFSYISLAGGALVKFLSDKKLPGIEVLEKSYEKFNPHYLDFIVIGSNTIDTEVSVSKNLDKINLGDKVKVNEDFKETVGGGGVNVSVCISRLSGKVGYIGKLSYEKFDKIKDVLHKNKVNLVSEKCSKIPVAKSVILDIKDKDRVIFSYRGQNSYLSEKDFCNLNFYNSNYYYLTSLTGKSFEALLKIVKKIKSENLDSKICYNPSLYLIKDENKKIKTMLNYIDILILNLEEAFELFNKENLDDIEKEFEKSKLEILIVTNGSHGSFAFSKKEGKIFQKAKKVKVVDTTGAGDCFSGTFFYFHSKNFPIKKALKYASSNSASVVSKKGTLDGLLYLEDLIKI